MKIAMQIYVIIIYYKIMLTVDLEAELNECCIHMGSSPTSYS